MFGYYIEVSQLIYTPNQFDMSLCSGQEYNPFFFFANMTL